MSRLPPEICLALIADVAFAGVEKIEGLIAQALPEDCRGRLIVIERDKRPAGEQNDALRLLRLQRLRQVTHARNARFAVNQRVDLAMLSGADGVHLPASGLPTECVKRVAPNLWIGRSCHAAQSLEVAEKTGADWAFLSPVATPLSKSSSLPPLGSSGFSELVRPRAIPIFALGGITEELVRPLMEGGAQGVAVIGRVLGARDPRLAVSKLLGDC